MFVGLLTLAGSVRAEFANRQGLMFQFAFDGVGTCPKVADLSGNGYQALVSNNVWGCRTTNAKCFSGFTTTTSSFVVTNAVSSWERDCTAVAWVRNINFDSKQPHVLFRAGGKAARYDGYSTDSAWQVTVATDGAVVIGLQDWGGKQTNNANAVVAPLPVDWQPETWYQVAVTVKATFVNSVRKKALAVYVTPEGSASVGEPVSQLEYSAAAGFGSSQNFIVGAARDGYYKASIVGGYFAGEIAGVTMFDRVVTTEELQGDVSTFQMGYHPLDSYASLHWNLNETGDLPVAVDATTNGVAGATTGAVSGGARAPQGTAYQGFSSTGDRLCGSIYFDTENQKNEILLWVRCPEAMAGQTSLLAGTMANPDDPGATQPWRVAVGEDGAVQISMQTWKGKFFRTVGKPYVWGKDWHLVSIRLDVVTLPLWDINDNVTNVVNGTCDKIIVSAAPAAKTDGCMQVLAEAHIPLHNSHMSSAANLVFGSAGSGYYEAFRPKSVLGPRGRLAEVMVKKNGWFDKAYANSLLSTYYEPPRGAAIVVR